MELDVPTLLRPSSIAVLVRLRSLGKPLIVGTRLISKLDGEGGSQSMEVIDGMVVLEQQNCLRSFTKQPSRGPTLQQ